MKQAALYIFRAIEDTVLHEVVNTQCEQLLSGHDVFDKRFLVEPRACKGQPDILRSTKAVLECGGVAAKDLLYFTDNSCGFALAFFLISDIVFVEVELLASVDGDLSLRSLDSVTVVFSEARFIEESCIWHYTRRPNVIKVCVPVVLSID